MQNKYKIQLSCISFQFKTQQIVKEIQKIHVQMYTSQLDDLDHHFEARGWKRGWRGERDNEKQARKREIYNKILHITINYNYFKL